MGVRGFRLLKVQDSKTTLATKTLPFANLHKEIIIRNPKKGRLFFKLMELSEIGVPKP